MVVQAAVSAGSTSTAPPFLQSTRRTCEGGLFCSATDGEEARQPVKNGEKTASVRGSRFSNVSA